ncbi:MAG: hypothetical protein KDE34_19755, partial [Anaerolineales bacterium]|nr:hypothetical protein [Anaerolineales bacterium]
MTRLKLIWADKALRWVVLAALVATFLYLLPTIIAGGAGFPLDDGWIHQTYARNLARTGRWEYVPGVVSAGSTAPLWTIWLALGYLLHLPYFFWVFLSGAVSLAWIGLVSARLWQTLWPAEADRGWQIGLLVVLVWPLIWAAGSGMETLLFIALGLQAILAYYQVGPSRWGAARVGLLAGMMILVRPDGLPLLLLLALALLVGTPGLTWRQRLTNVLLTLAAAALPLIPYFLFNRWASDQWWPNTFYAKQSEYAMLLAEPLWQRF